MHGPVRTLPERPHESHLRSEAKALLAAAKMGDASARARLRVYFSDDRPFVLAQAQLVVAREFGFTSWRALIEHIHAIRSVGAELIAAVRSGDVASIGRLLAIHPQLVDLCVDDRESLRTDTPSMRLLHVSVGENRAKAARVLIDRGADLTARNRSGRTALHDSLELGREEITGMLIEAGAEIDACAAAMIGDVNRLRKILVSDPAQAEDRRTGLPRLGWAAFAGNTDILRCLHEFGVRATAKEALAPAAMVGKSAFLAEAIRMGADPSERFDTDRATALHRAATLRYTRSATDAVRVLLESGADRNARDNAGRRPVDIARLEREKIGAGRKDFGAVIDLLEGSRGPAAP